MDYSLPQLRTKFAERAFTHTVVARQHTHRGLTYNVQKIIENSKF